nr:MAG TPA: hypothetical protein [Caudoviricetes sp.]
MILQRRDYASYWRRISNSKKPFSIQSCVCG